MAATRIMRAKWGIMAVTRSFGTAQYGAYHPQAPPRYGEIGLGWAGPVRLDRCAGAASMRRSSRGEGVRRALRTLLCIAFATPTALPGLAQGQPAQSSVRPATAGDPEAAR